MLYAIAALLLLTWLFYIVTSNGPSALIHILPGIAIECLVLQLIVGEDPV